MLHRVFAVLMLSTLKDSYAGYLMKLSNCSVDEDLHDSDGYIRIGGLWLPMVMKHDGYACMLRNGCLQKCQASIMILDGICLVHRKLIPTADGNLNVLDVMLFINPNGFYSELRRDSYKSGLEDDSVHFVNGKNLYRCLAAREGGHIQVERAGTVVPVDGILNPQKGTFKICPDKRKHNLNIMSMQCGRDHCVKKNHSWYIVVIYIGENDADMLTMGPRLVPFGLYLCLVYCLKTGPVLTARVGVDACRFKATSILGFNNELRNRINVLCRPIARMEMFLDSKAITEVSDVATLQTMAVGFLVNGVCISISGYSELFMDRGMACHVADCCDNAWVGLNIDVLGNYLQMVNSKFVQSDWRMNCNNDGHDNDVSTVAWFVNDGLKETFQQRSHDPSDGCRTGAMVIPLDGAEHWIAMLGKWLLDKNWDVNQEVPHFMIYINHFNSDLYV